MGMWLSPMFTKKKNIFAEEDKCQSERFSRTSLFDWPGGQSIEFQ